MNLISTSTSTLYPWQHQTWKQLQQREGRWPHAILLHGPEGIGKKLFAEWLAQSILCESPRIDGQACGACHSCGWFSQYSHPDYRRLRPENLETDDTESGTEDAGETKKSAKTPSKEIVINQVRQLSDFMSISTHRQGMRVVVIYPAEAMNIAAANALLKSLEEPGPNTVFILVTSSVDALLPTLVSRCQQFALTVPAHEQALNWLVQQRVSKAEQFLAEQGGAPLAALASSQAGMQEQQQEFLRYLQQPQIDGVLKVADKLHKSAISLVLSWMQRWLYDIFSYKLTATVRYYPRYQKEISAIARSISVPALLELIDANTQRRAVAEHPLSAKLVIEAMLLEYVRYF